MGLQRMKKENERKEENETVKEKLALIRTVSTRAST